jgi:twinkle protein
MTQLPDIDFEKYLKQRESDLYLQKVDRPTQHLEKALERLSGTLKPYGDTLPWHKTHEHFRFREGELTLWAGVNGMGKSLVTGMAALWMESPVVIASMEMLPEATLARMIRQASGMSSPSKEYATALAKQFDGRVYIYNQVGDAEQDNLFGMIHYASAELGVKHFFVDSLVKIKGVGPEDYTRQQEFVNKLSQIAKDEHVHIHLILHMRKQMNEKEMPDKFDVKGSGAIVDLADNLLIVYRRTIGELDDGNPTGFIRVAKHRHGEWEGTWGFWFHEESQQWVPSPKMGAMPWPEPGRQWSIRDGKEQEDDRIDDRLGAVHAGV